MEPSIWHKRWARQRWTAWALALTLTLIMILGAIRLLAHGPAASGPPAVGPTVALTQPLMLPAWVEHGLSTVREKLDTLLHRPRPSGDTIASQIHDPGMVILSPFQGDQKLTIHPPFTADLGSDH